VRQRVTLAGRETRSVFLNIDPEVAQRVERAAVTGEVLEPISSFPARASASRRSSKEVSAVWCRSRH